MNVFKLEPNGSESNIYDIIEDIQRLRNHFYNYPFDKNYKKCEILTHEISQIDQQNVPFFEKKNAHFENF